MWQDTFRRTIVAIVGLSLPAVAASQALEISTNTVAFGGSNDERSWDLVFVEGDAGAAVFGRVSAPDRPSLQFIDVVEGGPLIAFMERRMEQLGENRVARLWFDGRCVFAEIRAEDLQVDLEKPTASWMWVEASPEVWSAVAAAIAPDDPTMKHLLRLADREVLSGAPDIEVRVRDDVPEWASSAVETAGIRHRELEELFQRMALVGRR